MKDKNMAVLGIGTAQALGFFFFLFKTPEGVVVALWHFGWKRGAISKVPGAEQRV
jgi:hypothetical protein